MRKIKYYYNTHTLRYEKHETPLRVKLLRLFGFIATSIAIAILIVAVAFQYIDSPKEKILQQQNDDMTENYIVLQQRVAQLQKQMLELENRDNNVYRAIFESTPIPDSARLKEIEKTKEYFCYLLFQKIEGRYKITGESDNVTDQIKNVTLNLGEPVRNINETPSHEKPNNYALIISTFLILLFLSAGLYIF